MKYAIVQHSGYGYKGDATFARAVETRHVDKREEAKVIKAGGIVCENYNEAEDLADKINTPEGGGIVPNVRGSFSTVDVDGLAVYVPVREVVG